MSIVDIIDWQLALNSWPELWSGIKLSLGISFSAFVVGLCGGIPLGFWVASPNNWLRWLSSSYVNLVRGTPMLVQILLLFYVLPILGLRLSGFWAAVAAIGLNSAAYLSQTIRSGLNGVGAEQLAAAQALGFSDWQIRRYIQIPQAIRIVFPNLSNELVILIKDSSLASIIGVLEVTKQATIIKSRTFDAITMLLVLTVIYLCLTNIANVVMKRLGTYLFKV